MPNWNAILKEISQAKQEGEQSPFDIVRRKYLAKLHEHTGRNIIAYYSGFLSKPKIEGIEISDEDKNGFMLCSHKVERKKGLDLFLHTPGGSVAATESLVHYLKEMFGDNIRAIVPQIAMSAGTMIACACNEILMGKHSNIGPVDPQFSGIPAIGVLEEVKLAFEEIKKDNRASLVWNPILARLPPSFIQQCQWAIRRSEEFIEVVLREGMLKELPEPERSEKIKKAVGRLTDLTSNRGHDRHFHYQECIDMGLQIKLLEDQDKTLQDLVLTVHHTFVLTLMNSPAFKIIEDHRGRALVKQQAQQNFLLQLPQMPVPSQ
jgi:ATP-dependent protease ClpP protease subunit